MGKPLFTIVLFIGLLFLLSCKENTNYIALKAELPPYIPANVHKTNKLRMLVAEISNLNTLEGEFIGYAATPSKQKDYVRELITIGDTDALLALTSHKSPIVRVISFSALYAQGSKNCRDILNEHINDSQTYNLFSGCLVTPEPVNLTMFNTIKAQLSSEDKANFGKLIKAQLCNSKYWALNFFDASI